jgi:hypothetical protein
MVSSGLSYRSDATLSASGCFLLQCSETGEAVWHRRRRGPRHLLQTYGTQSQTRQKLPFVYHVVLRQHYAFRHPPRADRVPNVRKVINGNIIGQLTLGVEQRSDKVGIRFPYESIAVC